MSDHTSPIADRTSLITDRPLTIADRASAVYVASLVMGHGHLRSLWRTITRRWVWMGDQPSILDDLPAGWRRHNHNMYVFGYIDHDPGEDQCAIEVDSDLGTITVFFPGKQIPSPINHVAAACDIMMAAIDRAHSDQAINRR